MAGKPPQTEIPSQPVVQVEGLRKRYVRGGWWQGEMPVRAADDVNFTIPAGHTLALVGASGSGKSTVARCVTRLETPDAGRICISGTDIAQLGAKDLLPFRGKIQMIFQDAATAVNPRFSARQAIEEPLLIRGCDRSERRETAQELMEQVGLAPDWLDRRMTDFSGGQQQRLAIARALSLTPQLLVLDEALSGLDLSTQAQIGNLLLDLQQRHSLAFLLISHDLAIVSQLSHSIAVMAEGRIAEIGPTEQIIRDPKHAATRALLQSARAARSRFTLAAGAGA